MSSRIHTGEAGYRHKNSVSQAGHGDRFVNRQKYSTVTRNEVTATRQQVNMDQKLSGGEVSF